jgi:hypothetical protein
MTQNKIAARRGYYYLKGAMRTILLVLVFAIVSAVSQAMADAPFRSGQQIFNMLGGKESATDNVEHALQEVSKDEALDKKALEAMLRQLMDKAYAHGYITGAADALDDVTFALPKEISAGEVIDIVVKWMSLNAELLSRSAEYCVSQALEAAYPLPE